MRAITQNLVLAAVTLLVVFGILEVVARVLIDFDEFTPRPVRFVDPDKPIAFEPHKTWTYRTDEFEYTVTFNSHGRRDVEWTESVISDPRNVVFIGDSFVLGNGVEHGDAVPTLVEGQLEQRGRPTEVFNFGMPDGHPGTYALLLDDALASGFAAETVLVGTFIGNDYYDRPPPAAEAPEAAPPPARSWRPRSQLLRVLKLRVSQSPRMIGWTFTIGKALGISVYETSGSYIFLRDPTSEQQATFDRIVENFGAMKRRCDEAGRELRLVIFPNKIQVENGEYLTSATFDAGRPNRRIMEYCQREGIRWLDLLPALTAAFERGERNLFYPVDRHMNPRGNAIAAEAIAGFLLGR